MRWADVSQKHERFDVDDILYILYPRMDRGADRVHVHGEDLVVDPHEEDPQWGKKFEASKLQRGGAMRDVDPSNQLIRRSPHTRRCRWARIAPKSVIQAIQAHTRKTTAKSVRCKEAKSALHVHRNYN